MYCIYGATRCSPISFTASTAVPLHNIKKASPLGEAFLMFSLSKKEGTSKGLLPPFGEKSGKEEGKEERGVVPGAV